MDGRVHASLDQLGTPTGRFASQGPNLLGLPKDDDVRDCIEAPEERVFIDADYATIELRVLAQLTRDRRLMQAFREGQDLHRVTASLVLGKPIEQVTKVERQRAKAVNFGFAFGMGARKFKEYALKNYGAEFSDIESHRAKIAYERSYPEVTIWQGRAKVSLSAEVRTASGRLRFVEPRDFTLRLNSPVQGTAADGAKRALALLRPRLERLGARLVLFVHDQVLVEAPTDAAEVVKAVVVETLVEGMQHYVPDVPILVEAAVKSTWK